jgi:hypothetical protein
MTTADPAVNYVADDPAALRRYTDNLVALVGSDAPLDVLGATPEILLQRIDALSERQRTTPEKPGKWSVRDVVQHLADSELVGGFRFRMILTHDEPPIPGYDQDLWAEGLRYREVPIAEALADFTAIRGANLRMLRRARPEDFERAGIHSERGRETLSFLVRLYAGHDRAHLRQIDRIAGAVG